MILKTEWFHNLKHGKVDDFYEADSRKVFININILPIFYKIYIYRYLVKEDLVLLLKLKLKEQELIEQLKLYLNLELKI